MLEDKRFRTFLMTFVTSSMHLEFYGEKLSDKTQTSHICMATVIDKPSCYRSSQQTSTRLLVSRSRLLVNALDREGRYSHGSDLICLYLSSLQLKQNLLLRIDNT